LNISSFIVQDIADATKNDRILFPKTDFPPAGATVFRAHGLIDATLSGTN
jgi:hypothetical protein